MLLADLIQVEQAPRRASLRQRGVQADGAAVDTETRGGHVTLVNGEAIRYPDPSEPAQPRERHPPSMPTLLPLPSLPSHGSLLYPSPPSPIPLLGCCFMSGVSAGISIVLFAVHVVLRRQITLYSMIQENAWLTQQFDC